MEKLTNARRFIRAYNDIDYTLRSKYNFKRSMSFSDVIRKSVSLNGIVRKYENTLIDYSRLRNAIVHSNTDNNTMAEPHDNVVENFERIKDLLTSPLTVKDNVIRRDVLCANHDSTVKEMIVLMTRSGYSNIPVYNGDNLVGVANNGKILNFLGNIIASGKSADSFINNTKISDILVSEDESKYYAITSVETTLDDVLNIFNSNRKLLVMLITRTGSDDERPFGIISVADLMDLTNVLEE